MAEFTHYDPVTGQVMQGGVCADADLFMQHWPGAARLSGAAGIPGHHYVDLSGAAPTLRERPLLDWPSSLSLSVGQVEALTLPHDGTVHVDGTAMPASAGPVPLHAAWAGIYDLLVEAWPCRPHRMRVEVSGAGDPPAPEPGAIILRKSRAQIAALRQRRYLAAWPLPQQMEAHADAANGSADKRDQMLADLDAIKASLPYPPEGESE